MSIGSHRRGRYRIRSRLYDPTSDAVSTLSLKEKLDDSFKPVSKSHLNFEHTEFETDAKIPFKRPSLSNEEFQAKVIDLLEDIRNLSLDNFVQNYLLLSDKLAKYLN